MTTLEYSYKHSTQKYQKTQSNEQIQKKDFFAFIAVYHVSANSVLDFLYTMKKQN